MNIFASGASKGCCPHRRPAWCRNW